jgi:hypothetical protein
MLDTGFFQDYEHVQVQYVLFCTSTVVRVLQYLYYYSTLQYCTLHVLQLVLYAE